MDPELQQPCGICLKDRFSDDFTVCEFCGVSICGNCQSNNVHHTLWEYYSSREQYGRCYNDLLVAD